MDSALHKGKPCHTILCMLRHDSRDRSKTSPKRKRGVDSAMSLLIRWLSEEGPLGDRSRELFRLIKRLDQGLRKRNHPNADAERLLNQINARLERFEGVRSLFLGAKGLVSEWGPKRHGRPQMWLLTSRKELTEEDWAQYHADKEFAVVSLLLDAVKQGLVSKIGECGCGALFHSRSSLSRFCSDQCRIRFWEQSEDRKAQKREMAKKYYWLHKTKNVR